MPRLSYILICLLPLLLLSFPLKAEMPSQKKNRRFKAVKLPSGQGISVLSGRVDLPFYVYGDEVEQKKKFVPSGYMGDANAIESITAKYDATAPASTGWSGKTSLRVRYKAKGREGWAGLYWQHPANNWGTVKGAGLDLSHANRLTFWAKGEKGGEKIAQVKVGGIVGPYPDSDAATMGPLKLTREWKQYTLTLDHYDMSHIVGGFAVVLRRSDNPRGATIYLDEIVFRGKDESNDVMKQPVDTQPWWEKGQNE